MSLFNFCVVVCAKYLIAVPFVLLLLYIFLTRGKRRKEALLLTVVGLPLTYAVGSALGHFFYNARPFVVGHFTPLVAHAADNGFPSDHMLLAAALAQAGLHINRRLGVVLWILAVLIGAARVLAGVHHTVDIVCSASVAIVCVWLAEKVVKKLATRS